MRVLLQKNPVAWFQFDVQRSFLLLAFAICVASSLTDAQLVKEEHAANCPHGLTANDVAAQSGLDLTGKTALVTGGRSGLGYAISEALLRQNCTVVLASRNATLNPEAVTKLQADIPGANVSYMIFDLEDLESVQQFAAAFSEKHARLDYYFANAGRGSGSFPYTVDGYERIFQTNYVGQFLLLDLLMPLLRQSQPSRVVLTGSSSHSLACGTLQLSSPENFLGENDEDVCFSESDSGRTLSMLPFDQTGMEAVNNTFGCPPLASTYPLTKYLMVQLAREIAAREAAAGNQVYAYAFAPGNIRTDLNPRASCCVGPVEFFGPTCRYQLPYVGPKDEQGNPNPPDPPVPNHWSSPPHGAMAALYSALVADPSDSGKFYSTYWECEADKGYFPQGITPQIREQVYDLSKEWAGITSSTDEEMETEDPSNTATTVATASLWALLLTYCLFGIGML